MSASIRSRLLLLVLAWALPAVAALLAVVHFTARSEQQSNERTLRDTARAMSLLIERELERRESAARWLASSRTLSRLPALSADDVEWFRARSRDAMQGLGGWIELRDERQTLIDSRGDAAATVPAGPAPLLPAPKVGDLSLGNGRPASALITHPVVQDGQLVANVVVVMLPSELQRLLDAQNLPPGWIATVLDGQRRVVARRPGGASMVGRDATADVRRLLAIHAEGGFDSLSLDGTAVRGFFSSSPHGWSYVAAMPQEQFGGYLQGATAQTIGGALLLMTLAVGGALWVSRGIANAIVALKQMAARLQAGQPVHAHATGISECDDVATTLAAAAHATQNARSELERQVAEAVSRTRLAEQDTARAQRVAALGRLTGGVAHDVNNLLGVVGNSAHLVMRHAAALPSVQSPASAILRAVAAGSRLTQQLMRFAARRPLKPQTLELGPYAPELKDLLLHVVGRRIEVQVEVEAGTRPVVVDATELELALVNLALNARDAMAHGGVLRVHAHPAGAADTDGLPAGDYVAIDIEDQGSGLDADMAARVFEPFASSRPLGDGTGLGLAQVHGFCKQAGGVARLISVPGQGTKVSLVLPAGTSTDAALATSQPALQADSLAALRVAVVDDNEALGQATAALLRSYGARVRVLRDAQAALDATQADGGFDVVLSDILMPGSMDGLALARALRRRVPPIPVVLITGYAPHGDDESRDFIVLKKPTSDEELVAALLQARRTA